MCRQCFRENAAAIGFVKVRGGVLPGANSRFLVPLKEAFGDRGIFNKYTNLIHFTLFDLVYRFYCTLGDLCGLLIVFLLSSRYLDS